MSTVAERLVTAAMEYLGTPFVHQGRLPGAAMDCVAVPLLAARAAGVEVPDFVIYGARPNAEHLLRELAQRCSHVDHAELLPGDVLLFKIKGQPAHFAVFDGSCMIHADERRGAVVRCPISDNWLRRLHSVWRVPNG
jgi:cell wall-associated NlpC family hydrolase